MRGRDGIFYLDHEQSAAQPLEIPWIGDIYATMAHPQSLLCLTIFITCLYFFLESLTLNLASVVLMLTILALASLSRQNN